ncbi:DUF4328 domain-containing protein [Streptomyces albidoflavus]
MWTRHFWSLVYFASIVVFLVWFRRGRVNAEVFDPYGHTLRRGWAVGSWFVPFANLWLPRRVAVDTWRASASPAGRRGPRCSTSGGSPRRRHRGEQRCLAPLPPRRGTGRDRPRLPVRRLLRVLQRRARRHRRPLRAGADPAPGRPRPPALAPGGARARPGRSGAREGLTPARTRAARIPPADGMRAFGGARGP